MGVETISLYQKATESNQPFNAVIVDLTIQDGWGGKETMQKLAKMDPKVKTIASSGYSNDPVMADCKKYHFLAIIKGAPHPGNDRTI